MHGLPDISTDTDQVWIGSLGMLLSSLGKEGATHVGSEMDDISPPSIPVLTTQTVSWLRSMGSHVFLRTKILKLPKIIGQESKYICEMMSAMPERCDAFKILLSSHQEMPKSVHGRTIRDTETTKNKNCLLKWIQCMRKCLATGRFQSSSAPNMLKAFCHLAILPRYPPAKAYIWSAALRAKPSWREAFEIPESGFEMLVFLLLARLTALGSQHQTQSCTVLILPQS